MESPRQELFSLTQGYKTTQALYVAAKLGVADHLRHGPKKAEELAKEVQANPKALFPAHETPGRHWHIHTR